MSVATIGQHLPTETSLQCIQDKKKLSNKMPQPKRNGIFIKFLILILGEQQCSVTALCLYNRHRHSF